MELSYSTTTPGLTAEFKKAPEDFVVEEVYDGKVLEAKAFRNIPIDEKVPERQDERKQSYLHFTLEKNDWDLNKIVKILARKARVSRKRFSSCGTKDKFAITTQRISAFSVPFELLSKVRLKDCALYDFEYLDHDLKLGDHQGNKFTILLRNAHGADIEEFKEQTQEKGIPNYYGHQRFGIRGNTHEIGRLILKNDFENACKRYLCDTKGELNEKAVAARKHLSENWGDYKTAVAQYPKYLRYELVLLNHLIQYPNDYANALRRLPKGIFKMFVHAYQSYLFNLTVSERMKEYGLKTLFEGDIVSIEGDSKQVTQDNLQDLQEKLNTNTAHITAPLLGYDTTLSSGKQGEIEKNILEKEGTALQDFRISSMPEASASGTRRNISMGIKEFKYEAREQDILISFSLPPGEYATSLLRELMKDQ